MCVPLFVMLLFRGELVDRGWFGPWKGVCTLNRAVMMYLGDVYKPIYAIRKQQQKSFLSEIPPVVTEVCIIIDNLL